MKRTVVSWLVIVVSVTCIGCATKRYVHEQLAPLISENSDANRLSAKNTKEIQNVDTRMAHAISAVQAGLQKVDEKATGAEFQAQRASEQGRVCQLRASAFTATMANLGNYHIVSQRLLTFGFDDSSLTDEAQHDLDQLGTQLFGSKGYIVVVQGGTDSSGNKDYNYQLSKRRAEEVVRYLLTKYKVPAYRIYAIGIGEEEPVAPNDTADGREKNRRAEVQILSNTGSPSSSQSDASDNDDQVGQLAPRRH